MYICIYKIKHCCVCITELILVAKRTSDVFRFYNNKYINIKLVQWWVEYYITKQRDRWTMTGTQQG